MRKQHAPLQGSPSVDPIAHHSSLPSFL
jgi:hypothetical protein